MWLQSGINIIQLTFVMKNEAQRYIKILLQLWMLSIAAVFIADANALVLGEIHVASTLGQPLSARIDFIELTDADALQFKVRLADVEDYKKLGLQYPDGHKFRFELVNEPGKQSLIRVTTAHPVDDPFINLLIEISSASGKLIKAYTFLLDPALNFPVVADDAQQASPFTGLKTVAGLVAADRSGAVKSGRTRKRHHHRVKPGARMARLAGGDRHPMRLAMSLSISSYDPSVPVNASSDALQEELIVKEKRLNDLKLQIGEMQLVIKALQDKRAGAVGVMGANELAAGGTVESAVDAVPERAGTANGVASDESGKLKITAAVQPSPRQVFELNWQKLAIVLIVLLSGGLGFVWYRSRPDKVQHGTFDDSYEEPVDATAPIFLKTARLVTPLPLADAQMKYEAEPVNAPFRMQSDSDSTPLKFDTVAPLLDEQSEDIPEDSEEPAKLIVPPEYAILIEANKYLRAGNDELAEGALIRAIQVNPKNSYGYLALLKIYGKRENLKSFAAIAKQLKENCDETSFAEAAAMGRRLEPDNPLYAAAG
jgi:hypothetical protein